MTAIKTASNINVISMTKRGETTSNAAAATLPRLLYLADVPVESSYHGSALIHRLLTGYPNERLRIVESSLLRSQPQRRLPDVEYAELRHGSQRLLNTRFARWYSTWLMKTAAKRVGQLGQLLNGFKPEAVLSVTHGFSWLTAARFAAQYGLPLHLICHDDLPRLSQIVPSMTNWLEREFGNVYRATASRLCVSPFMREAYHKRYGSDGTVLYPSRSANCIEYESPPERLARNDHQFTVAFAGTINSQGYVRALKSLAKALEIVQGQLLIFGPLKAEHARLIGLEGHNVVLRGLVSSDELMKRFREEVDVLFVPMSFDPADESNMKISFPSKLTDYTAVGLPLLIYGPDYCSALRWAIENDGVAVVVDREDSRALAQAVQRLASVPEDRIAFGQRALDVGCQYFGIEVVRSIFVRVLCQQSPSAMLARS
jgi:glycosyltransferase involved in cell wall biosynthesis